MRWERPLMVSVGVLEAAFLSLAFLLGSPIPGVVAAIALCYFLIAFRNPEVAWAMVWLAVPFDVEKLLPGGSAITLPTEPMILIALVAWLARSLPAGRWRLPHSPLHLPLVALSGFVLLSTLWSVSPIATLKAWAMMGGYAAFGYLYFLQSPCDRRRQERWLLLVAVTGAVWGLFGVVRVLSMGGAGLEAASVASTYAYGAFRPFFSEHGTYSAYICMLLPLTLLAAMETSGSRRILYGVSALCIGLGATLAFARAGWLALAIVIPGTLILWARWRRAGQRLIVPVFIAFVVTLLVGFFGVAHQVQRHAASVVSASNMSNIERLNRWNTALSMARDHPVLGVGYGGFLDAYPAYRSKGLVTDQAFIRMGTHSEPLKLLCELGVVGVAVAVWFLGAVSVLAIRCFSRLSDPRGRIVSLGAIAGVGTYFINGIFNAYLVEGKVTVPFWVGIGVIAALGRRLKPIHESASPTALR